MIRLKTRISRSSYKSASWSFPFKFVWPQWLWMVWDYYRIFYITLLKRCCFLIYRYFEVLCQYFPINQYQTPFNVNHWMRKLDLLTIKKPLAWTDYAIQVTISISKLLLHQKKKLTKFVYTQYSMLYVEHQFKFGILIIHHCYCYSNSL